MRSKKITVTLILIVKNERESSQVIFPRINKRCVDEIFVMDGNSTDGTKDYFKKQGIRVFQQNKKGLGAAVIEARFHVKTDAFILFHPDGNENPKDIPTCATLLKKGHEFIIPSRFLPGGYNEENENFLKPRKWFNQFLTLLVNLIWNKQESFVTEIVQGFRAIRCDTFDKLSVDALDAGIDFQMVVKALKLGIPIYEFPTKEGNRLFGETHFSSFPTGKIILRRFFKELIS